MTAMNMETTYEQSATARRAHDVNAHAAVRVAANQHHEEDHRRSQSIEHHSINRVADRITTNGQGFAVAEGITGVRQVSHSGPTYGTAARRVEIVDGTSPRHHATLSHPKFNIKVASRSDSVSDIAFPEGAVEIEQHYYKGNVLSEHYGELDEEPLKETVIREVPVYKKEIDEIVKREQVVNTIYERVPKFNYVDQVVEVEHVVEKPVYKEVPVKKTVVKQVPKPVREKRLIEKVRYVPVTEEVEVEKVIEIPGEVVIQPRHVVRDETIVTDKHLDKEVPVVISQVVHPIMKDTKKKVRVPAKVLSPSLHTSSVRVPKPVDLEFHQSDVKTHLKYIPLTPEDYNSAFFQLNSHLSLEHRKALKPGHHVKVERESGYPVLRDRNLKFYRLPDSDLTKIEGYHAMEILSSKSSSSTSSSSSSTSSTSDITTTHKSVASKSDGKKLHTTVGHKYVSQPAPVLHSAPVH